MVPFTEVKTEWATNEKVALEVAVGASFGGARAMACMKHVGLNVAADPLFTVAYTGVRGGLVILVADDPSMHSSQNEQDSRFYARSAHVPMLVPADSAECKAFTAEAFALSEKYDTPVFVQVCTRIAHARSLVDVGERVEHEPAAWVKDPQKYVMMPGMARKRHVAVEAREKALAADANALPLNRIEWGDRKLGIVCAGTAYQYVKEAAPNASVLKLGMVYPLPEQLIRTFAAGVEALVVIEELEPFIENAIRVMGIPVHGKELTGLQGELSVPRVRRALGIAETPALPADPALPIRPPVFCPGCPHRATFFELSRRKCVVFGDIGCYTLGTLAPLAAMDASLCMGGSIGMAFGAEKAQGKTFSRNSVAVIGDSTFLHSGVTSLVNAVYNGGTITVLILDNRITGMTGHQPNPASGKNIYGEPAPMIDFEVLARACGVNAVRTVDPFDLPALSTALREELAREEVSVIVVKRPCALLSKAATKPCTVKDCRNCGACMKLGCPAIERGEKGIRIEPTLCVGCGLCARVCPFHAIEKEDA